MVEKCWLSMSFLNACMCGCMQTINYQLFIFAVITVLKLCFFFLLRTAFAFFEIAYVLLFLSLWHLVCKICRD